MLAHPLVLVALDFSILTIQEVVQRRLPDHIPWVLNVSFVGGGWLWADGNSLFLRDSSAI